jgi:hypothetical protein
MTGVVPTLRPIIIEGVKDGLPPAKIHRKILEKCPKAKVTLKQVQTAAITQSKKLMSTLPNNTIGDLHTYLAANILTAEADKHAFGVLPGWRANGPDHITNEAADICFVLTTKNLLKNAVRQSHSGLVSFVDIDQTYNLIDKGYPITIIGTVTRAHQFKLIAVGISRHEDQRDNAAILSAVKEGLSTLLGFQWLPKVGMSDRAGAISNAFAEVFLTNMRLAKCYFHVKKGLKDNKSRFSSETNYELFQSDCSDIAGFDTEQEFFDALDLLFRKWRSREKDAVDWFSSEWCTKSYGTWFSGFTSAGLPNTNNSLERFNRSLKLYVTSHQRLSFSKLLTKFKKELVYQSLTSKSSDFPKEPILDRQAWGKAQLWAKSITKANILKARTNNLYFVPTAALFKNLKAADKGGVKFIRHEFEKGYDASTEPLEGENFDKYMKRRRGFWKLQKVTANNSFACNCPCYLHKATCKHSLGMCILHHLVTIPAHWKCNSIEQLKRRGRPGKFKNCLARPQL